MFCVALGAFLYYFISGLLRFYTYPVSTNLEYKLQSDLEFPSVTLCNYNIIRRSYMDSLNDPRFQQVVNVVNPVLTDSIDINDPIIKEQFSALKMDDMGPSSAHQREDMFLACSFMSTNYSEFPCNFSGELLEMKLTQIGFCYTFHPQSYVEKHGALVSNRAGQAGGLFLRIDLQQHEYLVGDSNSAGMKVGFE